MFNTELLNLCCCFMRINILTEIKDCQGAGKFKKMSFIPLLLPSYCILLLIGIAPVPDEI
jgi:hypothetical protein